MVYFLMQVQQFHFWFVWADIFAITEVNKRKRRNNGQMAILRK